MTFIARIFAFIGGVTLATIIANICDANDFFIGVFVTLLGIVGALSVPRS